MKNLFYFAFTSIVFLALSCKRETKETPNTTLELETNLKVNDSSSNMYAKKTPEFKWVSQQKQYLENRGFKTFVYSDLTSKDSVLMQQYFIAFLKRGNIRTQNEEEAEILQEEHLEHLTKMYQLGYADISGPFAGDNDLRGITIYNVPTLKMADSLANADPMVQAGRLQVEVLPWWAAKEYCLR